MYKFPIIFTIDDVLPHIKNHPEFIVAERDDYIVINYIIAHSFPKVINEEHAILRECRGIIFDKKGKLISRPLHKFFNIGEKEETLIDNLSNENILLLEKLDGSMIRPCKVANELCWMTKMGQTDVGKIAEDFVKDKPNYLEFANGCISQHMTPIFELCTDKQRIVVKHDQPSLTLIAIRHNVTGGYAPYEMHKLFLEYHNIPYIKGIFHASMEMEDFYHYVKKESGFEGYVLRYDSGHMVKIKTDWYTTIHSMKELILFEKNVIKMILDNNLDDVKSHLQDDDRERLEKYENEFITGLMKFIEDLWEMYNFYYEKSMHDKKTFAVEYSNLLTRPIYKSFVFNNWDKNKFSLTELVKTYILKNLTTTKLDDIRYIFNCKY